MASPTPSRTSRRLSRDTGFPEPFDQGSNTTLPHPDADLSPNACISHDDLIVDYALKRKKLSFLHRRKHNRIPAHGLISPSTELVGSVLSLSLTNTHSGHSKDSTSTQKLARVSTTSIPSKYETESVQSKKDDDTPPTSPDSVHRHSKRSGFLNKLRRG